MQVRASVVTEMWSFPNRDPEATFETLAHAIENSRTWRIIAMDAPQRILEARLRTWNDDQGIKVAVIDRPEGGSLLSVQGWQDGILAPPSLIGMKRMRPLIEEELGVPATVTEL